MTGRFCRLEPFDAVRHAEPLYDALQRDAAVIGRSKDLIEETAARLDANLAAAKAQLDIEAPSGGTILEVVVDVGDIPLVGDLLVVLDAD